MMFGSNTETLITPTYQDSDGTIDLVVDNDLSNYDNSSSYIHRYLVRILLQTRHSTDGTGNSITNLVALTIAYRN